MLHWQTNISGKRMFTHMFDFTNINLHIIISTVRKGYIQYIYFVQQPCREREKEREKYDLSVSFEKNGNWFFFLRRVQESLMVCTKSQWGHWWGMMNFKLGQGQRAQTLSIVKDIIWSFHKKQFLLNTMLYCIYKHHFLLNGTIQKHTVYQWWMCREAII